MKGYFLSDVSLSNVSLKEKKIEIRGLSIEWPILSPASIGQISETLAHARTALQKIPIATIIDAIAATSEQFLDPHHAVRQEAEYVLPKITGASQPMVSLTLNHLFENLTRSTLIQLLEEELGDRTCLDQFQAKRQGGHQTHAIGPNQITHLLPGAVSGISVISLTLGLLAKSANLAKVSRDDFLLPSLFARTLHNLQPALGACLAVLPWDTDETEITQSALDMADCVVVYGNDQTIATIRERVSSDKKIICYGHKMSIGLVARECLHQETAQKAAYDISLYDQRGCLSPHTYYVEEGGKISPLQFCDYLAEALCEIFRHLPKGQEASGSIAEHSTLWQLRGTVPLRGGQVFSATNGTDWTLFYDPDSLFCVSPLGRSVWIKPIADLLQVHHTLKPFERFLQGIGIAAPPDRFLEIARSLAQSGASRLAPIGTMQTPPLTWRHNGRFRLLDLLHFVDLEL